MTSYNQDQLRRYTDAKPAVADIPTNFMANVFLWMFAGLLVTILFAMAIGSSTELCMAMFFDGNNISVTGWVILLAPLVSVLGIGLGYVKLPFEFLVVLFLFLASLIGTSLSVIFIIYTPASIISCLISTAVIFVIMAVLGYTTGHDLTSMGLILIAGLFGLCIASVINFFMNSNALDYVLSFAGIVIFTGLTAYDVQKLKRMAINAEYKGTPITDMRKLAIVGALSIYLDFINLFLNLLKFTGRRK